MKVFIQKNSGALIQKNDMITKIKVKVKVFFLRCQMNLMILYQTTRNKKFNKIIMRALFSIFRYRKIN